MKSTGKKEEPNLPPQTSKFSRGSMFAGNKNLPLGSKFPKSPVNIRPTQFITQHKGGN